MILRYHLGKWHLPGLLFAILLGCAAIYAQEGIPSGSQDPEEYDRRRDQEIRESLQKITTVFHIVATQLAEPIEAETVIYKGAIPGAISRLDPFSVFLDPQEYQSLQQQQRGVQQGFGAVLSVQAGKVLVLQSLPGSPFGRAGLGPGDRIVSVNGNWVGSLGLEELVRVLEAARKGKVRLSVLQGGSVVARDFELDPSEIPSPTVDRHFLLSESIGYLHVAHIEQGTANEIDDVLKGWELNSVAGVILDLRRNPGGSLDAAKEVASLFLPAGQVVVALDGKSVSNQVYRTETEPRYPSLPIVVLINGQSASAAEVIAAALQEHDRAWLVGETTFGKGVAESVLPLSGGSALVLTSARYFTPKGRSVQKPLPGTALAGILKQGPAGFTSDRGRPLQQTSGLPPDQAAEPWRLDEWMEWLQQSTAFVNFAQQYLERHGRVAEQFRADEGVLREFESFVRQAGAAIPRQEWERAIPFLQARVEAEILSQAVGIVKGDEAQLRRDPQVQAAAAAMEKAAQLLRPGRQ
jgi:carboxyl-terminal processing protease